MREGPPHVDETMSTETLLHEIANLRSRLRDLEEDGRSSICESLVEGDVATSLKKEVVKLADEKAKQEKEFMNQMTSLAIENQSIIANLKSKLARSQAEKEELEDQVEAMTSNHSAEIERLKENLTHADVEITEAKQEVDFLQQENEELRGEKNELLVNIQAVKLELENEKRRSESFRVQLKKSEASVEQLRLDVSVKDSEVERLREEIGEMNDSMIELEESKELMEGELKKLTEELVQVNEKLKREKTKSIDHSIFSAEKETLERANEQLEERLERFQAKLAEKDATIENLANSLKEERSNRRKIRKELDERDNGAESRDEPGAGLTRSLHGTRDASKEIEFLRRRNKSLNEEVRELRQKLSDSENKPHEPQKSLKPTAIQTGFGTPPRFKKGPDLPVSPRTAVSGLVASFEKRSRGHKQGEEKREEAGNMCPSDYSPSNKSVENRDSHRMIKQLESELREERELVESLKNQLSRAKSEGESLAAVEKKLQKSQDLVETLQTKISYLEKENRQFSSEIEQLQYDLRVSKEIAELEEEKKDEEREEEVSRLRSQVSALQSELTSSMQDIEKLNSEISALQNSVDREKQIVEESQSTIVELRTQINTVTLASSENEKISRLYDAQINKLKVELTNAQVSKDQLQTELGNRLKELQTELEAVEIEANEEIDQLKSEISTLQLAITSKDQQIHQLETEKNQLCTNMSLASNAKNNEFEELQSELIDKTAKNTAQSREIQALKMKIEELENIKRGKAEWLQSRVNELEQEMETLRTTMRNTGSWEDTERMRRENLQLKETIRELKMERRQLQERIESLLTDRSSSKSVQILRDRNANLKEEVEKLTRRLKKMEESITRFAI